VSSRLPLPQLSLRDSFVEAGSRLALSNPELFANAIQQLSAQFSLAIARNPEFLRPTKASEQTPAPKSSLKRGRSAHSEPAEVGEEDSHEGQKHMAYIKYSLPGTAREQEYYQCMICKEKRHENSFYSNHVHCLGEKPKVRWFCPLCQKLFAVTHRSGHIKNCHLTQAECSSPTCSPFYGTGSPSGDTMLMDRRVAMIASATAAAVVSAATRSSPSLSFSQEQPSSTMCPALEKKDEEQCCFQPSEKRMRFFQDDQITAYSPNFSSSADSPLNPNIDDRADSYADVFSASTEDDSCSPSSCPFQSSAATSESFIDDMFSSFPSL